ncbi:MAG: acetyl-CoA decarbonylase/synthase complex subunit gamma [Thermoplasmata archaeon]
MPTALEIYQKLPKTNCGDCGVPTCLAFAMQLANQKVSLDKCPHVSEEAKEFLAASAAPPIHLVRIGTGEKVIEIGDETELFRHEKKFYHPTAYAVVIEDNSGPEDRKQRMESLKHLTFDRVGQIMSVDMVGIRASSGDQANFASVVQEVSSQTNLPLLLISERTDVMEEGLKTVADRKPLIHAATSENWEKMAEIAERSKCPIVVKEESSLDGLAELTKKVKGAGVEDIVLDFGQKRLGEMVRNLTIIRRLAIKKKFRPLGYPSIIFAHGDIDSAGIVAALGTMKYASIVAFDEVDASHMYPLFTLRQNIYTDPQKPIQVKPGIYEIGSPTPDSPVMITTNFSLTYFTVSGDIESSKVPSYLLVADSEGLSVMTAFAADKFNAEIAAHLIKECGIEKKVNHRKIIIPGQVSRMSGKLQEESGWEVAVGPRDSSGIPKYLRDWTS